MVQICSWHLSISHPQASFSVTALSQGPIRSHTIGCGIEHFLFSHRNEEQLQASFSSTNSSQVVQVGNFTAGHSFFSQVGGKRQSQLSFSCRTLEQASQATVGITGQSFFSHRNWGQQLSQVPLPGMVINSSQGSQVGIGFLSQALHLILHFWQVMPHSGSNTSSHTFTSSAHGSGVLSSGQTASRGQHSFSVVT